MSKNGRLLYLIIEFEKDLRQFLFQEVVSIFGEKQTLGYLYESAKSRHTSRVENKEKAFFDLISFGELGEFISLNSNNLNPEIRNNINEFRRAMEILVKLRNDFAHPHSVNSGFEDESMSNQLKVYDAVELFQNNIDFNWERTKKAFINLANPDNYIDFEELLKELPVLIKHNLPELQHKNTTFIGRKEELNKLNKFLESERVNLISICGPGGLGKTALALEACDKLISEEKDIFDKIVFFTFKTDDLLNKGNISEYENSFNGLIKLVDTEFDYQCDTLDEVVEFLDENKTLLILDNTESISKDEILDFYYQFNNAKFVLTSRVGLGEVETRINLKKLKKQESIFLFRKLAEIEDIGDDVDISEIKLEELVSALETPLGIKWSIVKISEGISIEEILTHKDELLEFCTKGVFENINNETEKILVLLYDTNNSLTIGQISVFTELEIDKVQESINELERRSLLIKKREKSKYEESYELVEQGKEYIKKNIEYYDTLLNSVNEIKETFSKEALGDAIMFLDENKFSPKKIMINDESYITSSKLLKRALSERSYNDKTKKYLDNALQLSPNFFENYRVSGFVKNASGLKDSAFNDFKQSLDLAKTDEEKAWIKFWFSGFLFRNVQLSSRDEYLNMVKMAEDAYKFFNSIPPRINYAQILTSIRKFDETEKLLGHCLSYEKKEYSVRNKRKELNIYLDNQRRYNLEHLGGSEKQYDIGLANSAEVIPKIHEIIKDLKNDFQLYETYIQYFSEYFFALSFVSDAPDVKGIEKVIEYFLKIPRTFINHHFEKRIGIAVDKAQNNFRQRKLDSFDELVDILEFVNRFLKLKTSTNEIVSTYNGYFSITSGNSFFGVMRNNKKTRPWKIWGDIDLIQSGDENYVFGDKISCKVTSSGKDKKINEVTLIEKNTQELEKRILYIFSRKDNNEFPIVDMKTHYIFGALTSEKAIHMFGDKISDIKSGNYYLKGDVKQNFNKPSLDFDTIEEIYSIDKFSQFKNLDRECFDYIKHNDVDTHVNNVKLEISKLTEGVSVDAEVVNGEFIKIGNVYSEYDKEATVALKPGNIVRASINKIDINCLKVQSRITNLIK